MGTVKNSKKCGKAKESKVDEELEITDQKLEEEMANMLKSEYGEDTEVLNLIEELEKTSTEKQPKDDISKDIENEEERRCAGCGLDTLYINSQCSVCGHKLGKKVKHDIDDSSDNDIHDDTGYNNDNDE
jgi:hypothetical protein